MLGAGNLDQTVIIKRATRTQNDSGGYDTVFNPILTTYAKITEKSLSNDLIAQQPELIGTFEATIRKRAGVSIQKGDQVEWKGLTCEIVGFPQFKNKEFIKILIKTDTDATL